MDIMGKEKPRHRLPIMEWISHGDKRYSMGNIVNGTIITLYIDGIYTCGECHITCRDVNLNLI